MIQTLDCKNLECPQPVIKTKEAIALLPNDSQLDIELNSFSSIENVKRFAKSQNLHVEVKSKTKEATILSILTATNQEEPNNDKSFYALVVGSIVSAFLATACCLAPFLFLVFGVSVSSLSFLQVLSPYQPLFSSIAVGVIIYLWYGYFKRIKNQFVCSSKLCKNYKLYLSIGTVFVLIFSTYPYWVNYLLE
jgi:TusA-related sulfurtransferase